MNSIGRYPNGKAIWRCDACGRVAPWAESWGWYGSPLDDDGGTIRAIWCSPDCCSRLASEGIAKNRAPERELAVALSEGRLLRPARGAR